MGFLLRKISPNKWQPNLELSPDCYSADAITGCTRTQKNTLSVWHSETKDFEDESVEKLIVGLAVSMQQPAKIDVVWLEEEQLAGDGLLVINTKAETEFENVNELHKDIAELDHAKLAIVGKHIVKQFLGEGNYKPISRPKLIKMVSKWALKEDTFDLTALSDDWIEAVQKHRAREAATS